MGEVLSATIFFLIFAWICLFINADRDYVARGQVLSNVTYSYTQTAAKKGNISGTIFNEFEAKINKLGDFNIDIVAERFNSNGTITTVSGDAAIGNDLRGNGFDIITIYVSAQKEHFLSKLYAVPLIGVSNAEYRLEARAAAYIQ